MESWQPIDDMRRGMRPDANGPAVRSNGKNMRGAPHSWNRRPTSITREHHILQQTHNKYFCINFYKSIIFKKDIYFLRAFLEHFISNINLDKQKNIKKLY